jgi:dipeptidyl aminopeptidase/acylaminoacyl peptidase
MSAGRIALWIVVPFMLAAKSLVAQELATPLPIEALLNAPTLGSVGEPTFAPDGSALAYTIIDNGRRPALDREQSLRSGIPWYALGSDIWVSSIAGTDARNLTEKHGNNWAPSWSPDGRAVAFLSDRASGTPVGQAHLWIWERASGKLRQVSDLPVMDPWGRVGRLEWLADSRTVVVKAYPEGMLPAAYASLVMGGSTEDGVVTDSGPTARLFRFDPTEPDSIPRTDPNNLNSLLGELALVNVESGAIRRVSGAKRICSYALSPDRRRLAWSTALRFASPGSHHIVADIVVYDLGSRLSHRVVSEARLGYGFTNYLLFSWSPTSQAIAYRTEGSGTPDEVYVVYLDGNAPRRIADGMVIDEWHEDERPLWDDAGQRLFFVRSGALWGAPVDGSGATLIANVLDTRLRLIQRGGGALWTRDGGRSTVTFTMNTRTKRAGLATVDLLSGRITQLLEEDKAYSVTASGPVVTPDGRSVVYAAEDPRNPPNLWLAPCDGQQKPRQLSRVAFDLARYSGGTAEVIEWRGLDGDTLRGALIYPTNRQPNTRYPLIVKVYGGTDVSDDLNRFGFATSPVENLQTFASRGYAVLLADSRLRVGTPMMDLLKSVLPGVDRAVEMGVADPARIGLIGHSYGGYSALALIVQSRRFKAAVMRAGFGDLMGAYGQLSPDGTNYLLPWAERGQGRMGGSPWEVRERYIENSPIFYLDRVETPLLIVHGTRDNVPFLADEVFTGLRRLGKRVEYASYLGEGHWEGLWSGPNQVDYLRRVLAWFDRYLKGGQASPQSSGARQAVRGSYAH